MNHAPGFSASRYTNCIKADAQFGRRLGMSRRLARRRGIMAWQKTCDRTGSQKIDQPLPGSNIAQGRSMGTTAKHRFAVNAHSGGAAPTRLRRIAQTGDDRCLRSPRCSFKPRSRQQLQSARQWGVRRSWEAHAGCPTNQGGEIASAANAGAGSGQQQLDQAGELYHQHICSVCSVDLRHHRHAFAPRISK